jgi:hypothetical protein
MYHLGMGEIWILFFLASDVPNMFPPSSEQVSKCSQHVPKDVSNSFTLYIPIALYAQG